MPEKVLTFYRVFWRWVFQKDLEEKKPSRQKQLQKLLSGAQKVRLSNSVAMFVAKFG